MSAHVLLILLNELGKRVQMQGLRVFYLFFATSLIKIIQEHKLDSIYRDIKFTLKSHFWRKKVILASLCTQLCYGHHSVSRKSVNH